VRLEDGISRRFGRMKAWPLTERSAIGHAPSHGFRSHTLRNIFRL